MEPAKNLQPTEDEQSFEHLYRRHRADVYRFVLRDTGNREEAEDVTQTAFLNAYNAFIRSGPPERPKAWLFAIAENVNRRRFRTQTRRPVETPLEFEPAALVADEDAPTAREIGSALANLPFNQRTALALRELGGLSYTEIAEELQLSVSAVQMLLFRARRGLRAELEPAVGPRRALGGLLGLPTPGWVSKAFGWLGSWGARAGLAPKAAGIIGAAVVGTGVVAGTDEGHALPDVVAGKLPIQVDNRASSTRERERASRTQTGSVAVASRPRPAAVTPGAPAGAKVQAPAQAKAQAPNPPTGQQGASTPSSGAAEPDAAQQSGQASRSLVPEAPKPKLGAPRVELPRTALDELVGGLRPRAPEAPRLPKTPPLPKAPALPKPPPLPKAPSLPKPPPVPAPPVSQPPLPAPPVDPPNVPTVPSPPTPPVNTPSVPLPPLPPPPTLP